MLKEITMRQPQLRYALCAAPERRLPASQMVMKSRLKALP